MSKQVTDKDRRNREPQESRVYVHERCGGETEISGNDFSRVANPFCFVSQTYCSNCGSWVNLGGVSWADTGEAISAYRRRLRRRAPLKVKLIAWVLTPILGALIGAPLAWFFDRKTFIAAGIAGVVAAIFAATYLSSWLIRLFCQIDYRNKR